MTAAPVPHARKREARRAFYWLAQGWQLFWRKPGIWVLMALSCFLSLFVAGLIPVVNRVLAMVLLQIFAGGMVAAARHLHQGGDMKLAEVLEGFRSHAGNLAIVGMLLGLALTLAGFATMAISLVASAITRLLEGAPFGLDMLWNSLFADWLVSAAFTVAMLIALWFAPALVMLDRRPPFEAMQLSFRACMFNPGATAILALLLSIAVPTVISLTLGFGILLVIPMVATTLYCSYRDVFGEEAEAR